MAACRGPAASTGRRGAAWSGLYRHIPWGWVRWGRVWYDMVKAQRSISLKNLFEIKISGTSLVIKEFLHELS